jgi:hypothetical protein
MADTGHSIGTVFIELDLDPSRYTKGQQQLLNDATSTSLNLEKNFQNLGIKSDATFDLMRQKAQNSYEMIANSSKSSHDDIIRAEQAKADKIKEINEKQFGDQMSMIDKLKDRWVVAAAGIVLAIEGIRMATEVAHKAMEMMEEGAKAYQTEESFKRVAEAAHESAEEIVMAMKKASRGTIDESDLMQKAVKGMVLNLSG